MSAVEERAGSVEQRVPFWQCEPFWDRLNRIEAHHLRVQSQHESVRRGLEQVQRDRTTDLEEAWQRYCAVIAELDRTTAELEALRTYPE
jgi:hypothetical protein